MAVLREFVQRFFQRLRAGRGPLADVARGAGWAFGIKVAGAGLAYLLQVLLARWLGADQYGEYTYALAWAFILAIPATLGFQGGLLRFIPEHRAREEWALVKGVMIRGWQLAAAAGCAIALLGTGAIATLDARTGLAYAEVLLVGMWLVPLQAVLATQVGMGRGLGSVPLAYTPNQVVRPILLIGGLLAYRAIAGPFDARTALVLTIVSFVIVAAGQATVVWRKLPRKAREVRAAFRTRRWLRISLPLLLISAFLVILNRTDLIMMGIFTEAREVGIYNAAGKTATLVSFVLAAVNSLAAPTISELYTQDRREDLQRLATTVAQYAFWPSLAIALGLIALSGFILGLFGPEFTAGRPVLAILALGQVVNSAVGSVGYFMNMTGHQDESAKVFGLAALLNLVLNAIAIPLYGAVGAAVATAISMMFWNVWLNRLVWRRLGIRTSFLAAWRTD